MSTSHRQVVGTKKNEARERTMGVCERGSGWEGVGVSEDAKGDVLCTSPRWSEGRHLFEVDAGEK